MVVEDYDGENISRISIDVMRALQKHNPDVGTVLRTLTEMLCGALLQLKPGPRKIYEEAIIKMVTHHFDENKVIDLTNYLKPN